MEFDAEDRHSQVPYWPSSTTCSIQKPYSFFKCQTLIMDQYVLFQDKVVRPIAHSSSITFPRQLCKCLTTPSTQTVEINGIRYNYIFCASMYY